MIITSIRTQKNELPSTDVLLKLMSELRKRLDRAGFIANVNIGDSRSSMRIGLHMRSFRIDKLKLGPNADTSHSGRSCKAGYKLCDIPTWTQREQFNHLINDCFDKFKLSARIKSGDFLVRSKQGRINNWPAFQGTERLFEIKSLEEVQS